MELYYIIITSLPTHLPNLVYYIRGVGSNMSNPVSHVFFVAKTCESPDGWHCSHPAGPSIQKDLELEEATNGECFIFVDITHDGSGWCWQKYANSDWGYIYIYFGFLMGFMAHHRKSSTMDPSWDIAYLQFISSPKTRSGNVWKMIFLGPKWNTVMFGVYLKFIWGVVPYGPSSAWQSNAVGVNHLRSPMGSMARVKITIQNLKVTDPCKLFGGASFPLTNSNSHGDH